MRKVSYEKAVEELDVLLDDVSRTNLPVVIKKDDCSVVLISFKKFEEMGGKIYDTPSLKEKGFTDAENTLMQSLELDLPL